MRKRKVVNTSEPKLLDLLYKTKAKLIAGEFEFICPCFIKSYRELVGDTERKIQSKTIHIKYPRFRNWITYHGRRFDKEYHYILGKMGCWYKSRAFDKTIGQVPVPEKIRLLSALINEVEKEEGCYERTEG